MQLKLGVGIVWSYIEQCCLEWGGSKDGEGEGRSEERKRKWRQQQEMEKGIKEDGLTLYYYTFLFSSILIALSAQCSGCVVRLWLRPLFTLCSIVCVWDFMRQLGICYSVFVNNEVMAEQTTTLTTALLAALGRIRTHVSLHSTGGAVPKRKTENQAQRGS